MVTEAPERSRCQVLLLILALRGGQLLPAEQQLHLQAVRRRLLRDAVLVDMPAEQPRAGCSE
eukprot:937523-Prymnesium_polylepis.1